MRVKCKHCEYLTVPYYGPKDADILLIGEYPAWEEQEKGIPFVGDTGDILRNELNILGDIDYLECRVVNLWLHERNKMCKPQYHAKSLLKEIVKHKFFLLMGSEFGGLLYPFKTMDNNGRRINIGKAKGIITVNPAMLPKDSVGEFRYALARFKRLVEGENVERPYNFVKLGAGSAGVKRKPSAGKRASGRPATKRATNGGPKRSVRVHPAGKDTRKGKGVRSS
jgi:hypothetical protein